MICAKRESVAAFFFCFLLFCTRIRFDATTTCSRTAVITASRAPDSAAPHTHRLPNNEKGQESNNKTNARQAETRQFSLCASPDNDDELSLASSSTLAFKLPGGVIKAADEFRSAWCCVDSSQKATTTRIDEK